MNVREQPPGLAGIITLMKFGGITGHYELIAYLVSGSIGKAKPTEF